ncbi:MAG: cell division transport system ATP-binding protein [Planctomycetota bacterium]|jgi:cell division transport system ATP-binding protein
MVRVGIFFMIHYDRVSKYYDNKDISLNDVTLHIERGELVSIVGHSGAGKTTLIRLLLGEEYPNEGNVFFEGSDIHRVSRSRLPHHRRRIGVVFQDFKLLPKMTAFENIAFAMEAAGRSDYEVSIDVPHMLDLVNMADKIHRFPHQLSGGERQRLAIARALINRPDVVVADEPTGNLDQQATHEVVQILKKIHNLGTTVILATHDLGIVKSLNRRVITLDMGKIVHDTKHVEHHNRSIPVTSKEDYEEEAQ